MGAPAVPRQSLALFERNEQICQYCEGNIDDQCLMHKAELKCYTAETEETDALARKPTPRSAVRLDNTYT